MCVVTCAPAVTCRQVLPVPSTSPARPQLPAVLGVSAVKYLGQEELWGAEQQDAWDNRPQHPGPLATALWSPSNRILVL